MGRQPLELGDFQRLFATFKHSAFRLETLPQYAVEGESLELKEFLAGRPRPPSVREEFDEWLELVATSAAAGKKISRVHVLPAKLTPYLRYEIEWGYVFAAAVGEDIRLLLPSAPRAVQDRVRDDFWLLDNKYVVFVRYDSDGRLLGLELDDQESTVQEYCKLRDELLHYSVTLSTYLAMARTR